MKLPLTTDQITLVTAVIDWIKARFALCDLPDLNDACDPDEVRYFQALPEDTNTETLVARYMGLDAAAWRRVKQHQALETLRTEQRVPDWVIDAAHKGLQQPGHTF